MKMTLTFRVTANNTLMCYGNSIVYFSNKHLPMMVIDSRFQTIVTNWVGI